MPELPAVVPGEPIDSSTFGNPVIGRVLSRYADSGARDAAVPIPVSGDFAWLEATDELQVYDGSAWVTYSTKAYVDSLTLPSAWRFPTLLNGWSNFGAGEQVARIRREPNGLVRIQGLITGGTATSNTPIFNLSGTETPDQNYQIATTSNNAYGQIKVNASGNVVFRVGTAANLSLDGVYSLT